MHEESKNSTGYLTKLWSSEFSTHRNFREDGLKVCGDPIRAHDKDSQVDEEGLYIFPLDCDGEPMGGAEDVEKFVRKSCEDKTLQDIFSAKSNAWLDDRSHDGKNRKYQTLLTHHTLLRALHEPRFGKQKPIVDRRLIFIHDPNPCHILALAGIASELRVRDAIQKHLAFETSLLVHIPLKERSMFHLELHLPYFALRESKILAGSHARDKRQCVDLSFLTRCSESGPSQHKIIEAQYSIVICGQDDFQWVGWSFIDNNFEQEELSDDVDRLSYKGVVEDPIANAQLDQNKPLVNPREYFLRVLEVISEQILGEWERVVQNMRRNVRQYKDEKHANKLLEPSESLSESDHKQQIALVHDALRILTASLRKCEWPRSDSPKPSPFHEYKAKEFTEGFQHYFGKDNSATNRTYLIEPSYSAVRNASLVQALHSFQNIDPVAETTLQIGKASEKSWGRELRGNGIGSRTKDVWTLGCLFIEIVAFVSFAGLSARTAMIYDHNMHRKDFVQLHLQEDFALDSMDKSFELATLKDGSRLSAPSSAAFATASVVFVIASTWFHYRNHNHKHRDRFVLAGNVTGAALGIALGYDVQSIMLSVLPWALMTALVTSNLTHLLFGRLFLAGALGECRQCDQGAVGNDCKYCEC